MPPEPKVLSLDAWKALALKGAAPTDAILRKQYVADEIKVGVDGDERAVRIVITTGAVDRDGDTINPEGWKLTNYRKNPVVLWAHDYRSLPIGRNVKLEVDGKRVIATPHFVEPELYPLGETVLQMLRRRYLNASSVGFMPFEWNVSEDEDRKPRRGVDFAKQELLEYSIVPVPSNPEALIEARAAGIDLLPLKEWAEHVLDDWHQDRGFYLPRKQLERVLSIIDPSVTVPVDGTRESGRAAGAPAPAAPAPSAPSNPAPEPSRAPGPAGDAHYREGAGLFLKQGFVVQTLIFPKAHWDSADACKKWAKDHDFRADKVDETGTSWRLRQRAPGEFQRLRGICLMPNDEPFGSEKCRVKAVGGPLKEAVAGQVDKSWPTLEDEAAREVAPAEDLLDEMVALIGPVPAATPADPLEEALRVAGPDGIKAALRPAFASVLAEAARTAETAVTGRLPD